MALVLFRTEPHNREVAICVEDVSRVYVMDEARTSVSR